ncbi:DUF3977 family protein [Paenibacillus dokdonensis]|uniref:DUF3977 family protein n=1 Tax=Paenibacillus dokdonensis TaxID=2567944 RepID=A0ABU6GKU4_9BACL|nr:DUF3977 family protein [Paenibacillus dokdonensis]MEC0240366.1 DUF3977 family protein [Paenibacillus dokdonensis]
MEIGYGNRWFVRTEIENKDGTETEIRGMITSFKLRSVCFFYQHLLK